MVDTKDIRRFFESLAEFEDFKIEWIRACARINPEGTNARDREAAERRYTIIRRMRTNEQAG